MAEVIPTADCSVVIQLWIDDNAVKEKSTDGCYAVDNRTSSGSQNEGSAQLVTALSTGTKVCWTPLLINGQSKGAVQIASMGNSMAWGFGGQPQSSDSNSFTGQVQNAGLNTYSVDINVISAGGTGKTATMTLSVNAT